MEAKTKKYLKIGGFILGGGVLIFAGYKGYKYFLGKYSETQTEQWTAPDGSVIMVPKSNLKPATHEDAVNAYNQAKKVLTKTKGQWSIFIQAIEKNMNRMEAQMFAGFFAKMKKTNDGKTVGLTETEWKSFYKLMESLKS